MTGEQKTSRASGALLALAAIGTVMMMAHHPTGAHSGGIGGIVHGAMIGLLMVMTWGFLQFAWIRGIRRPLVSAGMLAYGVSLFGHIGAATINGFIVPALAAREHGAVSHELFLFAWEMNQALAKLGVAMTGVAYVAWGFDLLTDQRRSIKLLGGLGLVAGVAPAALLMLGIVSRLDVKTAFFTYALHAAWTALVGVQLARGRVSGKEAAQ